MTNGVDRMIVVTAGIVRRDGKILICKRPQGKRLAGYWEFPGGKMEQGETPEECLKRELREELGFETRVGKIFDAQVESEFREFIILYYEAEIAAGHPQALEHEEVRYVDCNELSAYLFASSDAAVAAKLMSGS